MKHLLTAGALALALAGCSGGDDQQEEAAHQLSSGVDFSGFDESVEPADDFFMYVNGGWIERTEIPADRVRYGSFDLLREQSEEHQRTIIEDLSAAENLAQGSEEQKIRDFYNSLMDAERAEQLGAGAVQPLLDRIENAQSREDLFILFAEMERSGITGPFGVFVNVDSADSTRYASYLTQAGLGLPNRDYYLREGEKFEEIRARYPEYIARLFELAGIEGGAERAEAIVALETALAEVQWAPEENRDATKTNNRYLIAELDEEVTDGIAWDTYLQAAGIAGEEDIFVRQPSYFDALGGILSETDLETWKDYLRFHALNTAAPWMSSDFVEAEFDFNNRLVRGQQQLEERWKRATRAINAFMGEALGKVYVERYFPPEAKERMDELVANLLLAFEESINNLDWMSEETKARAQEKRANFTTKIGYPEEWEDYSAMEIRPGDAVGNLIRALEWRHDDMVGKLGNPVDRGEWFMSPQTVNAYHNPRLNEIVFPAAILQPPFFNLDADDAVNYGAIGAVIGHEVGHAFDDQGRKTDAQGNLNDWWTEADATAFEARADALVAQYNQYEPIPDLTVNGRLTLGENIGDLTGVSIAYKAYQKSLGGEEAPVIDGLTGEQRFFIGFGQIWRGKAREEFLRQQVLTDPHSPGHYRANGPLSNFTPFYEAFGVDEDDGMYRPPEERVQIW